MSSRGWDDNLSPQGLIVDFRAIVGGGRPGVRPNGYLTCTLPGLQHLVGILHSGTCARFCRSAGPRSSFGCRCAASVRSSALLAPDATILLLQPRYQHGDGGRCETDSRSLVGLPDALTRDDPWALCHVGALDPANASAFATLCAKGNYARLFQRYGHGAPDLDRARRSASNALILIVQDEIVHYGLSAPQSPGSPSSSRLVEK